MAWNVLSVDSDVLSFNVLGFLSMKDLVMLDTAAAGNRESRKLVCERLKLLTYSGVNSLVFTSGSSAMKWFLQRRVQLTSLAFGREVLDDPIIRFSEYLRSLKEISWHGSYITDLAVSVVVKHCPGLLSLKLSKCYNITDAAMIDISKFSHNLTTFHMSYSSEISMDGFVAVLEGCSKLSYLSVAFCRKLNGTALQQIALQCAHLQSLSVDGLQDVAQQDLAMFVDRCPRLTILDMNNISGVTGTDVAATVQHFPNLQSLHLRQFNVKDTNLRRIVSKCRDLRSVNLAGCGKITDFGCLTLALFCPQLQAIDLSRCRRVTDDTLVALSEHCPLLTSVVVSYCFYVTDTGISALSRGCPQLHTLHMLKCGFLCERALIAAIARCKHLTSLELGGNRVSNKVVVTLASLCPKLTSLRLESCPKLSFWAVRTVCNFLHSLTVLHLQHNAWVTNDHVIQIAECCPDLTILGLSSKHNKSTFVLSAAAAEALALHCPKLAYLGSCECSAGAWKVAQQMQQDGGHRGVQLDLQLTPLPPSAISTFLSFLHW